jgi:hypothetical protein
MDRGRGRSAHFGGPAGADLPAEETGALYGRRHTPRSPQAHAASRGAAANDTPVETTFETAVDGERAVASAD